MQPVGSRSLLDPDSARVPCSIRFIYFSLPFARTAPKARHQDRIRLLRSRTPRYARPSPRSRRRRRRRRLTSSLAHKGISATSYGLYQFYSTFTVYPDSATHPIRSKLRAAIRAESTQEYERAANFFEQAYDLCLDLYRQSHELERGDDGLIKLSGIAVRWGGMWEQTGQLDRAIQVYDTGFQPIADRLERHKLSSVDGDVAAAAGVVGFEAVKRGAGLALKLGDLWTTLGAATPSLNREAQSEAERYYAWAVQELMRMSLTPEQKDKVKDEMDKQNNPHLVPSSSSSSPSTRPPSGDAKGEKGLELPGWIGEVELVAAFERLGDLYSRQGRIE